MKRLTWLMVPGLVLLASCGGKSTPPPESAENSEAAEDEAMADNLGVTNGTDGASAPGEQDSEAPPVASDQEAGEASADETGAESEGPPPSENLEAYMGSAPVTPEYKTVQENMNVFKFCYLDAMRSNPDLQGTIRIRFTVTKAGKVSKAKSVQNGLNKEVETCVLKELKKLQFPKRDSNRTVEYPFKFIPAS